MSTVKLTAEQREEILRDNWNSHDARWYLKVAQELGFDVANRLNHIVIRSMGKTEMKRLAQAVGAEKVRDVQELLEVFDLMMELYFPQQVYRQRIEHKKRFRSTVAKCFVAEMVLQAGAADVYDCACAARFEGWLAALGLEGGVSIERSMLWGEPTCEIVFRIAKW